MVPLGNPKDHLERSPWTIATEGSGDGPAAGDAKAGGVQPPPALLTAVRRCQWAPAAWSSAWPFGCFGGCAWWAASLTAPPWLWFFPPTLVGSLATTETREPWVSAGAAASVPSAGAAPSWLSGVTGSFGMALKALTAPPWLSCAPPTMVTSLATVDTSEPWLLASVGSAVSGWAWSCGTAASAADADRVTPMTAAPSAWSFFMRYLLLRRVGRLPCTT